MTVLAARPSAQLPKIAEHSRLRWQHRYVLLLAVLDTWALSSAAALAAVARFHGQRALVGGTPGLTYLDVGLLVVPAWLGVLALGRCYERRFLGNGGDEFRRVLDSSVRFLALLGLVAYGFKVDVARGYLSILLASGLVLLLVGRLAARTYLRWLRRGGRCVHRVVLVGRRGAVAHLVALMHADPGCGLLPVAACSDARDPMLPLEGHPIPVLGEMSDVVRVLGEANADTVAVAAGSGLEPHDLEHLARLLEGTGVDLLVQPKLTSVFGTRISERPVAGLPMLHVEEPELGGARRLVKGFFDLALGAVALLLTAPLLLLAALAIRVTSPGPALFRQQRVGKGGKLFICWKLRTMYVDAEAHRDALRAHNRHGADGVLFKLDRDPRVTSVGRWLRRYSIDELPQLVNVMRGQMSLVGPRPPLPTEVEQYSDVVRRRLLVKPGMTGLWQVSGRSDLSWEESVALDLRYVEGWSLGMDLLLLLRTVVAVVRPRGAY